MARKRTTRSVTSTQISFAHSEFFKDEPSSMFRNNTLTNQSNSTFGRVTRRSSVLLPSSMTSKSARAYQRDFFPSAPLAPQKSLDNIINELARFEFPKKLSFILMVCRYWSLKREMRRGASLLKRLHLEPWTANANSIKISESEKRREYEV